MKSRTMAGNGETFRAGFVAIVGSPNAGKSTLMNAFVGQKVSIVTNKPQTTRHKILGILTRPRYQAVFLDTPGLLQPHYSLHRAMMNSAESAISDADLILFMVDANHPGAKKDKQFESVEHALRKSKAPRFLIVNKIDLVKKNLLLPIIAFYTQNLPFEEVYPISALNGAGTDELLEGITTHLPVHPSYYPDDIVSDEKEKFFVAEIIREKILETFRDEVPYSAAVDIVDFSEQKGRKDVIAAEVYVERESQKGILIGKGGTALKRVGELARKDIEKFLDRPVFLELRVKVREGWREKDVWLERLGYKKNK